MKDEKREFLQACTVLTDTREQKNKHITEALDRLKVSHEARKLPFGDYSFSCGGIDFTLSCAVERKANAEEIYNNITQDRERFEKEMRGASAAVRSFTLLIENVADWDGLKAAEVPREQMIMQPQRKVFFIGERIYPTLQSWKQGNRYGFDVKFVPNIENTAAAILEIFYWHWHNFKKLTAPRR